MPQTIDPSLFESIIGSLPQGLYVVQEGRAIYLNDHFGRFFGYDSVSGLAGRSLYDDIYPDRASVDLFRSIHEQMVANGTEQTSWAQISARADGTPFWLEVEARKINFNGRPAILGIIHDQTECKLIAEAMHVSQETLRLVLDAMEDRVYVVTDEFKVVYANRKMRDGLLGDIETDPCYRICRGLPEPCDDCTKDEVFTRGEPMYKEFLNERTGRWYSVIELAIRMPGLDQPTKLAVARDITNRRDNEEKIRGLSHRLINAQEEERRRLSRELHDDLGQRLNAVKIGLETLAEDVQNQPEGLSTRAENLCRILQKSVQSVRDLSTGLRPPSLERLGLVETVRAHCGKLTALQGLMIDFSTAGMQGLTLSGETEINLFRVIQEALHNVIKHSEAGEVSIRLVGSYPMVRLLIEDDGKGFELSELTPNSEDGTSLGLAGMAERAELLGGRYRLTSQTGQGTRIVVEVPAGRTREVRYETECFNRR